MCCCLGVVEGVVEPTPVMADRLVNQEETLVLVQEGVVVAVDRHWENPHTWLTRQTTSLSVVVKAAGVLEVGAVVHDSSRSLTMVVMGIAAWMTLDYNYYVV
jgi:hypothetical protein